MISSSDPSVRVLAPDHILVQEIEGQAALLNTKSERYFGIDDVGTRMWNILTTSESVEEAYDKLEAEYDVDPTQLRQDVTKFIALLVEHDLVHLENPVESS
jgi:hypothetical protein